MSTRKNLKMTAAQRAWFKEFEDTTGGDAPGLEDFEEGRSTFAEAAKRSLACYRMQADEQADRLERALDPLIL